MVSVYQEHTDLAASSLSVVVPSSSLLQHLPERHQAEQDPKPSTAPSQDQSPINCIVLQAQLSSSALPTPYLFVFTPSHVSCPESGPSGLQPLLQLPPASPPAFSLPNVCSLIQDAVKGNSVFKYKYASFCQRVFLKMIIKLNHLNHYA